MIQFYLDGEKLINVEIHIDNFSDCDNYISYAEFENGVELTEEELIKATGYNSDKLCEYAMEKHGYFRD